MQRRTFFALMVFGLVLRAVLAPLAGHPFDNYVYYQTGQAILAGRDFYGLTDYSYPPMWAGFLTVITAAYGPLAAYFGAHPMPVAQAQVILGTTLPLRGLVDWVFEGLAKIPLVVFDTLLAALLYRIVAVRFRKPEAARVVAVLFYLNPVVLWISAVWGTIDVLPTYFALLGSLLFLDRRGYASGVAFGVAIAFKYYPLIILLALILGLRERRERRVAKETVAAAFVVLVAVSIPFLILDPGSYVGGILSPAGGVFVGNLSIWTLLSNVGVEDVPAWIASLDILLVVGVIAVLSWVAGGAPGAQRDPLFWIDLSLMALLVFYALFRIVNDQYVFWIIPFLTLKVVLGHERLAPLLGISLLVVLAGLVNVAHYSFFLPMLTISPNLAPWVPRMWSIPPLRVALSLLFWSIAVVLLWQMLHRLVPPRGIATFVRSVGKTVHTVPQRILGRAVRSTTHATPDEPSPRPVLRGTSAAPDQNPETRGDAVPPTIPAAARP